MEKKRAIKPKSIKKGIFYNGFYQIITTVAPLITAPYVSRVMGVEGYGFFNKVVSIAYYFFIFAMLGVNTYGNREIARVRDDDDKRSETFWQIYFLQLILGLSSTILFIVFTFFCVSERKLFYYVMAIYVFSTVIDTNWYAFGIEEFKFMTIRNTIIKLLTVLSLFLFVRSPDDLIFYFLIYVFGVIFGLLPVWPLILSTTHFVKPKWEEIWKHFKPNFILFLPYVASSLYTQMDKIMVGVFVSDSEVGFYNYAENILAIPMGLMTTVTNVMLPRSSYLIENGKEKESKLLFQLSLKYTGILNIAMVFGIIAVSDIFIPWYLGDDYRYTAELLMLLSPIVFLSGVGVIVKDQLMIPEGREKEYTIGIFCGAIINVVLNLYFIYKFYAVGACISTIITFIVVMIVQIMYTRKQYNYPFFFLKMLPYVLIGVLMLVMINCMKNFIQTFPVIVQLLILVVAGIICYCGLSYFVLRIIEKDNYITAIIFGKKK